MPRLLIVSNRLPITVRTERGEVSVVPSAGGLATAMRGPHERHGGLWIGWPGDISRLSVEQRREVDRQLAAQRTVPVALSASEVSRYYDGYSNAVLWPAFHYLLDKVKLDSRRDFEAYEAVNERFAALVAQHYQPGDMIWVHDYQLMLVPEMLRRRLPDAPIGFFLHIPFPSDEVFRTLPQRERILRGLLGASVVGFHTVSYRHHFATSVARILGIEADGDTILFEGRQVRLGAYPISIDAAAFAEVAARPEVQAEALRIRVRAHGQQIILGIDRLDYTKGILRRLLAVERFFDRTPELRRRVRFIQLAVPSRENVEAYAELRREVSEAAGRINGQHGTVDALPIHLLYRSMSLEQVVALYLAADVMMVTPLRDGMNLVCKEFVAVRLENKGALILSELCGAAAELREALTVNPYDMDAMAAAVKRALLMPVEEQQIRMRELRRRVTEHDVHRWAASFLTDLERAPAAPAPPPSARLGPPPEDVVARVNEAKQLVLLIDYDGTLVPIAPLPDLAMPDDGLRVLLHNLAARPGTKVHLVSGRRREDLARWFGALPIGLHAEHGFASNAGPGQAWTTVEGVSVDWKAQVRKILDDLTGGVGGAFVEEKPVSLAVHYRNAEPERARELVHKLAPRLAEVLREHDLEVIQGAKVLEVRPRWLHKGLVVRRALEWSGVGAGNEEGAVVVAIGDDRTDEDLFVALPAGAVSIHVGMGPSQAGYRLPDSGAVRRFLAGLIGG